MEILILVALGIMALTIIFLKARQTIKGLAGNDEANNCTGCSGCCNSAYNYDEERKCRI